MNLAGLILRAFGWKVQVDAPDLAKCIICVAPHTSNWDFILGKLAYASVGRTAGFLMKDTWFFFPLGPIFKAIGGIPVARKKKGGGLVDSLIARFRSAGKLSIAITPEGTRSRTARWHTGFLQVAVGADVPCLLGVIDYPSKTITVNDVFIPTGDIAADMRTIKDFYRPFRGKYPDKFTAEDE